MLRLRECETRVARRALCVDGRSTPVCLRVHATLPCVVLSRDICFILLMLLLLARALCCLCEVTVSRVESVSAVASCVPSRAVPACGAQADGADAASET